MAMRHEHAPVHGVQFHPESVASELGRPLLAAFLALCRAPA
ncbi:MAG: glutamine amidotransferase-related protein [Burkholderiales bacterium]